MLLAKAQSQSLHGAHNESHDESPDESPDESHDESQLGCDHLIYLLENLCDCWCENGKENVKLKRSHAGSYQSGIRYFTATLFYSSFYE